jgi:hypothetical protein
MSTVLFLNGLLNYADPFLGLPLYAYLWALTLLLAVVSFVVLYFVMWKPMSPLAGLFWAQKHQSNVSLIFNKFGAGEMVTECDGKCIFDVENPREVEISDTWRRLDEIPETPLEALYRRITGMNRTVRFSEVKECHPLERVANVLVQGVKCDLIWDSDRWTVKDSPQHKAIVRAVELWNESNENDPILTYRKFNEYLLSGKILSPKGIEPVDVVSWARIDSEFPIMISESQYAGKKRELIELLKGEGKEFLQKLCIWFLLAGLGIAVLITTVRLVTHYF